MTNITDTIAERHATHGDFTDQSDCAQAIKSTFINFSTSDNLSNLENYQREALDLIATKIARILTGDPMQADHWHDIAGYATLVEERVQRAK